MEINDVSKLSEEDGWEDEWESSLTQLRLNDAEVLPVA
jgi:hypothetical protein